MGQEGHVHMEMGGRTREQILGLLPVGMLAILNLEQLQAELALSKL